MNDKAPHVNAAQYVIPAFDDMFHAAMSHTKKEYWLQGGRNSTKSSFVSILIVLLIVTFPFTNAVIVRRFSNTLRDSVFNQFQWAIVTLGLQDWFKATYAPMELTYKPTGQKIVFRGMDDPLKLKGIKFTVGYCAIHWFEELDQFNCWEDIQSALKSFKRGGSKFWTFYTYNPPKTLWSWVNVKSLEMKQKPTVYWNHSTYLDVIAAGHIDWIGEDTVYDAEWDKEHNEKHYRWEMLGEITGTGGSVFENVVEREITDSEIYTFDNQRNGIDWGWFPDPWRFVRMEWQRSERRLIIYEEHSENKKTPRDTGQIIVDALTFKDREDSSEPYYHNETVWCDDTADGKAQMATYIREYGIRAKPARKGNMRKLSYLWLAGLREIVIDPKRCPLTFKEFMLCEYAKDKEGNWIEDFNDGNDHSIDAVRYGMMEEVIRGK